MLKRFAPLVLAVALTTAHALAQVDPPRLDPTPSTEKQTALLKEGAALHDRGDYDAAISKYEEVLKENPANAEALYEIGFAYFAKKDYKKSLEFAYKGAQYKSNLLSGFYVLIGNDLDSLGESRKAVEVYKSGIKLQPRNAMLHYNLAITYRVMNRPEDARKSVKQAIALKPDHSSSHLMLGVMWYQDGYKTPALLAASRFLVLEPRSQRSAGALGLLTKIMGGGVTQGKNPNEINITLDMSTKKDEGDFGAIDLVMGLGKAASMTEKDKGKTETQLLVEQFETYFAIMAEQSDKADKSKFAWKYYVPYFTEMKQKNLVEPFVYYISQSGGSEEVSKWLAANRARVDEFLNWSKAYRWPAAD